MLIKKSAFLASRHQISLYCNQTLALSELEVSIEAMLTAALGFNQRRIQAFLQTYVALLQNIAFPYAVWPCAQMQTDFLVN